MKKTFLAGLLGWRSRSPAPWPKPWKAIPMPMKRRPSGMRAWLGGARRSSACSSTGAFMPCPPEPMMENPSAASANGSCSKARSRWPDTAPIANDFNPVKYDPAAWAGLAKEAGMRYMVITSKHHDGFALFPTEASKWNIVDATPWKKDLIGPLADAARAQGLKFGLYYSQAQDWTNPGGAKAGYKDGEGWDDAQKGSFDQYIDQIAVPQVREILTRYQPDVLWWDTPHLMTQRAREKTRGTPAAEARHHPQQPSGRWFQGRHGNTRAAHPVHGFSRPRLGNLHDDERHLGLQELRPSLEAALHPHHQPRGHRQQGRKLSPQRRARPPKAKSRRNRSNCSRKSAPG